MKRLLSLTTLMKMALSDILSWTHASATCPMVTWLSKCPILNYFPLLSRFMVVPLNCLWGSPNCPKSVLMRGQNSARKMFRNHSSAENVLIV